MSPQTPSLPVLLVFASSFALAQTPPNAQVGTGIANSGNLRIEGNVSINVRVESKVDDLIAILERRAAKIRRDLAKIPGQKSLLLTEQFNALHKQHTELLKAGKLVAAHEVLREIHGLSFSSMNLDAPYCKPATTYFRGSMISIYLTGIEDSRSLDYEPPQNDIRIILGGLGGCATPFAMAPPLDLTSAYSLLLASVSSQRHRPK